MIISQSKLFLNFNDVTIMEQEKQNQQLSIDHIIFNSRRHNACTRDFSQSTDCIFILQPFKQIPQHFH